MLHEFDALTIRRAAAEVPCDERSYRKELCEPGSVRGVIGALIRAHIAQVRARATTPGKPELGLDLTALEARR